MGPWITKWKKDAYQHNMYVRNKHLFCVDPLPSESFYSSLDYPNQYTHEFLTHLSLRHIDLAGSVYISTLSLLELRSWADLKEKTKLKQNKTKKHPHTTLPYISLHLWNQIPNEFLILVLVQNITAIFWYIFWSIFLLIFYYQLPRPLPFF